MARAARDVFWLWFDEADDSDAEQRAWKRARLEGILAACERTGVLSPDELGRWRALIDGAAPATSKGADPGAAGAFLEAALSDVRPMARNEDPDRLRAGDRFHGALDALSSAGVIGDDDRSRWHQQELSKSAPWLSSEEVEEFASFDGVVAIGVPATTEQEEAADEAFEREHERLSRRGALRRAVTTPTPERHDGLAVFAVVVREESTELLFHLVGPPHGEYQGGFAEMDAYRALTDALVPPRLSDDAGTAYEPVSQSPMSSHGTGGMPDPERPRVVFGGWRYFPAAPPTATAFVAEAAGARWTIPR
jgi:hypothetical protein